MEKKEYDVFIIGHISLDEIVYKGEKERLVGGAVMFSSYAAAAGGSSVGVMTKVAAEDAYLLNHFNLPKEDIYNISSKRTTSIRNEFLSDDREKRNLTVTSIADSFEAEDLPHVEAKIFHLGGLIAGEFDVSILELLLKEKVTAVDMQGFVRHAVDRRLVYKDWEEKNKYLPYIKYLKVDAAEAEIMTGYKDRRDGAKALYDMGAGEIVLTYNTEALVYNGREFCTAPFKPRNLSGRTGRGDTCFCSYLTERLNKGIEESLLYAAALTSLKMETPGPFKGTRTDVDKYIKEFY